MYAAWNLAWGSRRAREIEPFAHLGSVLGTQAAQGWPWAGRDGPLRRAPRPSVGERIVSNLLEECWRALEAWFIFRKSVDRLVLFYTQHKTHGGGERSGSGTNDRQIDR